MHGMETGDMEWRLVVWNGDWWYGMETGGMEWRLVIWNGDNNFCQK